MSITQSTPNNITSPDGNSLAIYLDDDLNTLRLKDIYGNVENLNNYIVSNTNLQNVGGSKEIYVNSTTNPAQIRTLVEGANVTLTQNANTITIDAANATGTSLYYGSFISTQTQTTIGGEQKAMTLNSTILSNGVSIVSNSRIQVAHAGIYNLQFSAQVVKTQGGSSQTIYVYLRKNGNNVLNSNTAVTLANNNQFIVLAWNFFETLNANEYVELMWYATDQHIQISRITNQPAVIPDVPSLIVTMNRVG